MTKTTARHLTTTYRSGCETCFGLATHWDGSTAHLIAQRHASTTGHKGVWYQRETTAVYDITEPLTLEELDALESMPIDPLVSTLGENATSARLVGQCIRQKRKDRGKTQAQMAEVMGISRPLYIALEQGQRPLRVSEIERIAATLGMTKEQLLELPA
jgi:DNA-binding XRE family transcriptional regulator